MRIAEAVKAFEKAHEYCISGKQKAQTNQTFRPYTFSPNQSNRASNLNYNLFGDCNSLIISGELAKIYEQLGYHNEALLQYKEAWGEFQSAKAAEPQEYPLPQSHYRNSPQIKFLIDYAQFLISHNEEKSVMPDEPLIEAYNINAAVPEIYLCYAKQYLIDLANKSAALEPHLQYEEIFHQLGKAEYYHRKQKYLPEIDRDHREAMIFNLKACAGVLLQYPNQAAEYSYLDDEIEKNFNDAIQIAESSASNMNKKALY